jgi:hypothetical protein
VEKGEQRVYVVGIRERHEEHKVWQLMVDLSSNSEVSEDEMVKSYIENEKKRYLIQARQNE